MDKIKMDEFIDDDTASFRRLKEEYFKHGSLVIGYDFDGTINDFHGKGFGYPKCRELIRNLKEIGCKVICWTAYKDLDKVAELLKEWDVPCDGINTQGIDLGYETKKPFFSALLDDRAGLKQVYNELNELYELVIERKLEENENIVSLIKAPNSVPRVRGKIIDIFLAGSIDMGKYNWQNEIGDKLEVKLKRNGYDGRVRLISPLREKWDNSIEQSIDNAVFNEQVNWELHQMTYADFVLFNFEPDSKSPITLLELGSCLGRYDVFVRCPKEFYRHGNVEITTKKFMGPDFIIHETIDSLLDELIENLK